MYFNTLGNGRKQNWLGFPLQLTNINRIGHSCEKQVTINCLTYQKDCYFRLSTLSKVMAINMVTNMFSLKLFYSVYMLLEDTVKPSWNW